jgi:hypothetical protein
MRRKTLWDDDPGVKSASKNGKNSKQNMTNIVAVTALIMTTVSTNWTRMAPATYVDWTSTNRFQLQTGILVTNVTANLPWKGTTLEVILEEQRGPVIEDKRMISISGVYDPQIVHFKLIPTGKTNLFLPKIPPLPPTPKAPSPLPLGLRIKE